MSWFSDLFSTGAKATVDSISTGLDSLFTSDEERLQAKLLLQKELNNFQLEMEKAANQFESEITERWKSDNEHIITRLVRPVSYSVMLGLFVLIVLFDGNLMSFTVNPEYIPVLQNILITMTIAYFGSRGFEKIKKMGS